MQHYKYTITKYVELAENLPMISEIISAHCEQFFNTSFSSHPDTFWHSIAASVKLKRIKKTKFNNQLELFTICIVLL